MGLTNDEMDDLISSAVDAGMRPIDTDAIRAIAARAVELVAARGGTMTAEAVSTALSAAEHAKAQENRHGACSRLRQHIAAQGARIAVLEASTARAIATEVGNMSDGERAQYLKGHDDGAELMRAACLEAAMTWVQATFGHGYIQRDHLDGLKSAIEGAAP